ncbi:MAG: helix-turn-helix domain-containing protein [Thermomicrobiales bacterium]
MAAHPGRETFRMFPALAPYIREADYAVRRPWWHGPRRLTDYLLIYVQEGDFVSVVRGVELRFAAGEFCLIQPNVLHTLEGRSNTITPYAHMDLFYDPDNDVVSAFAREPSGDSDDARHRQPGLLDLFGVEVPVRFQPSDPIRFRETLLRMIGIWQQGDVLSRLEAHALAMELILTILKTYGTSLPGRMSAPDSLNWVTSYLMFHLSDPITVADMAARAGLSPSRFAAVFRQRYGCPPYRHLRRLRIAHAQNLLESSDLILEDVALRSGFASAQHLSAAFRQETGETPGDYRRKRQWRG